MSQISYRPPSLDLCNRVMLSSSEEVPMPDLSKAIEKAHNDLKATEQDAWQLQRGIGP